MKSGGINFEPKFVILTLNFKNIHSFGSSHSASTAYQNWPTGHNIPHIKESLMTSIKNAEDLALLNFEKRLSSIRPQLLY